MYKLQPIGLPVFTTLAGKIEPDVFLPPKLVKSDQPFTNGWVEDDLMQ